MLEEQGVYPPERLVTFTVPGVPAPQGSKVRTKWGVREDNPATRPWRSAVAWEATAVMLGEQLLAGPLGVRVSFYFPRPKSHFGSGKNADVLKPSAPEWCAKKPDGDKLCRAILDSMSGIVYTDDAQVVDLHFYKRFGTPRAEVTVFCIESPWKL